MKILTIVGARPQFIKAAMVSRAIIAHNRQCVNPLIVEEIIHTGQHYDSNMSDIFFNQMQIPQPVVNLQAGTGRHGDMTGRMLAQIEREIVSRKPDWVLVFGDTNSTLAGALAAAKLNVPVAHVEAGLRSFNKRMPEEINRILTDQVSSLLFCPTKTATANLVGEGVRNGVYYVGDVMYDSALMFCEIAGRESIILKELRVSPKEFLLVTVHRAENADNPIRLQGIMSALTKLAGEHTVIFPVHPRTRMRLSCLPGAPSGLKFIEPVSFLDMVQLEKNAYCILTDSGGVQKEAYFHGVACITLRDETEWVETVEAGWNQVVGTAEESILAAFREAQRPLPVSDANPYGDGHAAEKIVEILIKESL